MVAEYVTGIKAAWDVAKALKVATDAIDDAHLKLQMAELISALADAKIEAAESTEKIALLQKQINTKNTLEFDGAKYMRTKEDGSTDGPFCPTCYDSEAKEIRLQSTPNSSFGSWFCRVCKGRYN